MYITIIGRSFGRQCSGQHQTGPSAVSGCPATISHYVSAASVAAADAESQWCQRVLPQLAHLQLHVPRQRYAFKQACLHHSHGDDCNR